MAYYRDKSQRNFRLTNSIQQNRASLDFNRIKVGKSVLDGDISTYIQPRGSKYGGPIKHLDQKSIKEFIAKRDIPKLREISNIYFRTSGIYSRLCQYMAYLYRYDWFITPQRFDNKIKDEKVLEGWLKACAFLENCDLKSEFKRIALKVLVDGCYYGYKIEQSNMVQLQDLPAAFCRSRYKYNGMPAVEFNIRFFDEYYSDHDYKLKVLKSFPKEFQKAYVSYKNGTLTKDFNADELGWFLLDPTKAVKFNLCDSDAPLFISVVPAILDLDYAKKLDKDRMAQQLLKIIVQKLPLDKNGDLIFDMLEAQDLHNNAVAMVGNAIGVDVLTTFADVAVEDLSDRSSVTSIDELERVERSLYNEAGTAQKLFNSDGNIAVDKSIANDEATMSNLLHQFITYANGLLGQFNSNPKRLKYKVDMLPTTIYNFKDVAKMYKEQTQLGFSKLLPQVALGHSQLDIIATAVFENQIMNLNELFTAPQMSSTMSSNKATTSSTSKTAKTDSEGAGRPELPDDQKTDKTIQNLESQS